MNCAKVEDGYQTKKQGEKHQKTGPAFQTNYYVNGLCFCCLMIFIKEDPSRIKSKKSSLITFVMLEKSYGPESPVNVKSFQSQNDGFFPGKP